jgi:acyl dehydratase
MKRLYAKVVLGAVRPRPKELPDRELTRSVEVDRSALAAYDRVCGFRLRDELPATYPHVLAFPLAMELMASGSFPFSPLGLVHVGNRIEQTRPIRADETLDLRVWAEALASHERGRQFELHGEAAVGGEVVWRDISTYLHREGGGGGSSSTRDGAEPPEASAVWTVPDDTGRRYARVSGDANPIHLHSLTAKALGQPGAIPRRARGRAPRRLRRRRALQAPAPPPRPRRVLLPRRRVRGPRRGQRQAASERLRQCGDFGLTSVDGR